MKKDCPSSGTSSTLLLRLQDLDNQEAWDEFVERYAPKIYQWCRRYQLQESDAADITQNVLIRLVKAMRTFEYNPSRGSFRAWLKTVTNNVIRDFMKSLYRPGRGTGDSQVQRNLTAIQAPEAREALASVIEEEGERELLWEAEDRVKLRVKARTWDAYRLTVTDGQKAAEAANVLKIPVADIYVAKSRVSKLIRTEVEKLNHSPDFLDGK